jgi:hypothetical protein
VLASVFWGKDGILLVDCLERGATITAEHYVAFLDKMIHQLVFKRRGKLSKGILFLHKAAINAPEIARSSIRSYEPP